MKAIYRYFLIAFLVLALISAPLSNLVQPVAAASAACVDSAPVSAAYTATVCITSPADGVTFTGNGTITATVSVTGTNPGVARMVFYLNGVYVLTDFYPPFTFTLPTNKWVDGTYTLSAEANMKDAFVTSQANISVIFNTGTITPLVNNNVFVPTSGTTPASGQPFILAAAGDGAGGEPNAATVTNLISSMNPNLLLYIGDVYQSGTATEFINWYAPSTYFGRFKSITDPTVGNHDFGTGDDAGYKDFWDNVPDYYSFNAGGWHFISLNSYSQYIDVDPTSAEYQWLQVDLAANSNPCTIVYYHHPYLSIGQEGGRADLVDIWKLLTQNKVTLVINGHDHEYQRWLPLDGNGNVNPSGTTQFIIGTGGHSLQTLATTDSRVAFASDANPLAYGALKLALYPDHAVFDYMSITGPVLDSGSIQCFSKTTPTLSIYLPLLFH